ncbi:MAG: DUF202 domain-containing protein [Nitriliruptor sp.]|uniref:DUF202 domain-containing protein n=1 Tax=Nitriliruptor sp. TaxID=2448056 RepID=UPI0034A013AB
MSATDPPGDRRVFDEGLQAERTSLAWDRTALTVAGVGALLARAGGTVLPWAWYVAGAAFAVAAAGLLLGRSRYLHRDASLRGDRTAPGPALIAAAGVTGVAVSLAAVAVVVGMALSVR